MQLHAPEAEIDGDNSEARDSRRNPPGRLGHRSGQPTYRGVCVDLPRSGPWPAPGDLRGLIPDAGSRPLRQGQEESSRRVAKRDKAMVQIEALRLFILCIDDKRVNGNLGPARTLYCIPQQGAAEFTAMIVARDGKAPP